MKQKPLVLRAATVRDVRATADLVGELEDRNDVWRVLHGHCDIPASVT